MATVRFHVKILADPEVSLSAMVDAAREVFEPYGVAVTVDTVARLDAPHLAMLTDLDVGDRPGEVTDEMRDLFGDPLANWSGWVRLDGPAAGFLGAPATVSRQGDVTNVYVRGGDKGLWQRCRRDGTWQGWRRHRDGPVLDAPPAAISMNPDHEQVFVTGTDGQIRERSWRAGEGWGEWSALGAPSAGVLGAPAAVSRRDGVASVYVRGTDNNLWQLTRHHGDWRDWQRHPDGLVLASNPAVASMGRDHEHVFVAGADGQLWHKSWRAWRGWTPWSPLSSPPGGFAGAPATVSRHGDVASVYVCGADTGLWELSWRGDARSGGWQGWRRHHDGGVLTAAPGAGSAAVDDEQVFVRGTDGALWHKWWFGDRRSHEVVVFFVRATTGAGGPVAGRAAHPEGAPGAVVTRIAGRWTLARMLGQVYGLPVLARGPGGDGGPAGSFADPDTVTIEDARVALASAEPDYPAAAVLLGTGALPVLGELAAGTDVELAVKAAYLASLVDPGDGYGIVARAAVSDRDVLRAVAAHAARNLDPAAAGRVVAGLIHDHDLGVRRLALAVVPVTAGP